MRPKTKTYYCIRCGYPLVTFEDMQQRMCHTCREETP